MAACSTPARIVDGRKARRRLRIRDDGQIMEMGSRDSRARRRSRRGVPRIARHRNWRWPAHRHIRNHNKPNAGETLQSESSDGGKTWSEPHPIGVWGLPSFLLRLRDDRLLMTYGHRRAPLGNQPESARIMAAHGPSR
jgi:hypothetical protein